MLRLFTWNHVIADRRLQLAAEPVRRENRLQAIFGRRPRLSHLGPSRIAGLEDHSSDFTGLEDRFQDKPFHVNDAILRGRSLLNAFTGCDFCRGFP